MSLGSWPRMKITVSLPEDKVKERIYLFGNETADKAYVHFRDPGKPIVYLVPKVVLDPFLLADLRDKTPYRFDTKDVKSVKLKGWKKKLGKTTELELVREGDKVRLQFEGWPAVQFAGWPSVAVGTFGGRVYLVDPTANDVGRFRILVEPDPEADAWPNQDYLRQGVRTQGWVLLQEVSAGWEIWRQINGFPPTREPKEKDFVRPLGPIGK